MHFPHQQPVLGVLGGMGPSATTDFLQRLIRSTPATRDQDHLATVVYSNPATPDRSDARLGRGPDPYPYLLHGIEFLDRAGCDLIAIPCNTAHYWYDALSAATDRPIVHIVDALAQHLGAPERRHATLGLLATDGTVRERLYHPRLESRGYRVVDLSDLGASNPVMLAVRREKAGDGKGACQALSTAIERLADRGVQQAVVACTDLSAVAARGCADGGLPVMDASQTLAAECVRRLHFGS